MSNLTLDQIKAEMRKIAKIEGNSGPVYNQGFKDAVSTYEYKLQDLEAPADAKLRRVREKVENARSLFPITGSGHEIDRLSIIRIIDAELKEKKMKKEELERLLIGIKQDIHHLELIPELKGQLIHDASFKLAQHAAMQIVDKALEAIPIAPPLELETEMFVKRGEIDSDEITTQIAKEDGLCIDTGQVSSPAEARDLAKILMFWAEFNKLPERVTVRGGK